MRRRPLCFVVAFLTAGFAAAPVLAQSTPTPMYYTTFGLGFGARALGMGGAFIAIADDITAMSYNPAGLSQLIRPEFSMGMRFSSQRLESLGYSDSNSGFRHVFDPYTAAYHRSMFDYIGGVVPFTVGDLPVVVGISRSVKGSEKANYGYLHHYEKFVLPQDSVISETSERNRIDNAGRIEVTSFSVSFRPFEFLHLGYNANLWKGDIVRNFTYQSQDILYSPETVTNNDPVLRTTSELIRHGFSHDFGLMAKFRRFSLGFIYRPGFKADFQLAEDETDYEGTLHWPASFGAGLKIQVSDLLTLSADYDFTDWSEGRVVYADQTRVYPDPLKLPCDSRQIRFGSEYLISLRRVAIPIRLGWFFNRPFFLDGQGHTIDFQGLTCGSGLALKALTLDLAAVYHFGSYNNVKMAGADLVLIPTKEANWEVLASISFRLTR